MNRPSQLDTYVAAVLSDLAYHCSDDGTGTTSQERVRTELAKRINQYPEDVARELAKLEVRGISNQDMVEFRNKITDNRFIALRGIDLKVIKENGKVSLRPFSDIWAIFHMSKPNRMTYAQNRIEAIKAENPNVKIIVTGHSLGGRYGIEIGKSRPDVKVIAFNAAQPWQGREQRNTYHNIFSYRTPNDFCNPSRNKGPGFVTYFNNKSGIDSHSINNFTPRTINSRDQVNLGGVDLSISDLKNLSINAVLLSNISNTLSLLTSNTDDTVSGVKLSDLAVALKVFYHPKGPMDISFSLDPKVATNPEGPWQQKIFYPDQHFAEKLLEGTELGEALFEADWLMKQISMGVTVNSLKHPVKLSKIALPNELISQGLGAHHDLSASLGTKTWCRFWIVVENIEIFESRNENRSLVIEFGEVKMGVKARLMSIDPLTQTLVDDQNQNLTSSCHQFAEKLSRCYDTCCKYYPQFDRLKQIVKAISLAKLMRNRCIPIDMKFIDQLYEKSKISNFQKDVPQLVFSHENSNHRIQVSGGVNLNVNPETMNGNKRELTCQLLNENQFAIQHQLINSRIINQTRLVCCVTGRILNLDESLIYFKDGCEQVYSREAHPSICNECDKFIDPGQPFFVLPENEFFSNISPTYHKHCFKCFYSKEPIIDRYVQFAGGYFLPKYVDIVQMEAQQNQEQYNSVIPFQQPIRMHREANVKKSATWICEFCTHSNLSTYCICELCFQQTNQNLIIHSKNTWICKFCTFANPSNNSNCEVCYQADNQDHITHSKNTWKCEFCTFVNPSNNSNCGACYQSKRVASSDEDLALAKAIQMSMQNLS